MSGILSRVERFDYSQFVKALCQPAQIAHFLSIVPTLTTLMNTTDDGIFSRIGNVMLSSIASVLYVVVLNVMCKEGYNKITWVVVGLPLVITLLNTFKRITSKKEEKTSA